ncbi:proteasome assembly chaperone 4-like [Tropilaelaps mercedesae]|uniref:Proteasome assembly chaperone 4-like n=1 Tax=Tropilaelaps mercedesae TaxID=418985 RepID=A0A1V9XD42_9ACAR|nr:proteasome assembly chaperone 4-like [Tropilaelaps mercedesae]
MAANASVGFVATTFRGHLDQREVYFHVIRMTQAFFLWIGDDSKELNDLAVGMPPLPGGVSNFGVSTRLLGNTALDALSQNIAQKLAKKTGCQVFVSVNLRHADKNAEIELQKRILEELTLNPEVTLGLIFPRWEKGNFDRPRGSYGLRDEYASFTPPSEWSDDIDLCSEYGESICSDQSSVTSYSFPESPTRSENCPIGSCGSPGSAVSLRFTIASHCSRSRLTLERGHQKRQLSSRIFTPNIVRIMSLLVAAGVAAFASFMYNVPIMQRVEMKSLRESLNRNVYCQRHAVDEIMRHVHEYTTLGQRGPVLLFLTGPEGCGKTHTINIMAEVNPSWTKIVATHEQANLNQLGQEEFVANVRKRIRSSKLNFIFVDDVPSLREGSPFVEMKLKPLLTSVKFESTLVFVVITMLSHDGKMNAPAFLASQWEYQMIPYSGLNRTCVQLCAADVIVALDRDPRKVDLDSLMQRFDFQENDEGQQVSVDGCKSVPIKVAIYLEGDPPVYDEPIW